MNVIVCLEILNNLFIKCLLPTTSSKDVNT